MELPSLKYTYIHTYIHTYIGLDFSKDMYAALASLGFTLVFATVSLFAGSVTDKYPRNVVATIACMAWSLATALQAFATQFNDLIPLRAVCMYVCMYT